MTIAIHYASIDNQAGSVRTYKTLKAAQKFAHDMLGETPTFGTGYAVSDDGIGKISVEGGCTLAQLFPRSADAAPFDPPAPGDADFEPAPEPEIKTGDAPGLKRLRKGPKAKALRDATIGDQGRGRKEAAEKIEGHRASLMGDDPLGFKAERKRRATNPEAREEKAWADMSDEERSAFIAPPEAQVENAGEAPTEAEEKDAAWARALDAMPALTPAEAAEVPDGAPRAKGEDITAYLNRRAKEREAQTDEHPGARLKSPRSWSEPKPAPGPREVKPAILEWRREAMKRAYEKGFGPRWAEAVKAAQAGVLPNPPDFDKPAHSSARKPLAEAMRYVDAKDIAGLKAMVYDPEGSTGQLLHRFIAFAIMALEAPAGKKARKAEKVA